MIKNNMLDEVSLKRIRKLPEPRVAKSRIGTKSTRMEQFVLLEKNDIKRLKDSPQDDLDCHIHQCVHCIECLLLNRKEEEMMLSMQIRSMKELYLIEFNTNPDIEICMLKMNVIMKQMIKCAFVSIYGLQM